MYYTRTKNNHTGEVSIEVYADHSSLAADRRFFNRSDGIFSVREIGWGEVDRILSGKRTRKPDEIRIMTKDGIHFADLPEWLRNHIVCRYRPQTWGGETHTYEDSADFLLVA